jgi:hypothetical protein
MAWKELNMMTAELKTIIRQSGDAEFVQVLNEIRKGDVSNTTLLRLQACS